VHPSDLCPRALAAALPSARAEISRAEGRGVAWISTRAATAGSVPGAASKSNASWSSGSPSAVNETSDSLASMSSTSDMAPAVVLMIWLAEPCTVWSALVPDDARHLRLLSTRVEARARRRDASTRVEEGTS